MTAPPPSRSPAGRHRASAGSRSLRQHVPSAEALVGALALVLVLCLTGASPPLGRTSGPGVDPAAAPGQQITLTAGGAPASTQAPVRVRVPSIGLDSGLVRLGVDADGALVPPADFASAGWFTGSPAPGEVGPSVLAGHVDSADGPAVFSRLRDLSPGDEVLVDRADGTTLRFAVVSADRYPKDRFPTDVVYGPTARAELRLITCGGEFDADRRSYRDNVVVSAVLAS